MSEPTQPPFAPFAAQAAVMRPLAALAAEVSHLPAAEMVIAPAGVVQVEITPESLADWEAWREALGLPGGLVEIEVRGRRAWLTAAGPWGGAVVRLAAYEIALPTQAEQGLAAEQRHQLDPADAAWRAVAPMGGAR